MARRPIRRATRSWRPSTSWAGVIPASTTDIPAASKVLLATFVPSGPEGETLRRIRGLLTVQSDQSAATEFQVGALGCAVFTDTAIAAGVASLPDPVTDVEDEMWVLFTHIGQQFLFSSGVGKNPDMATQYVLDSKAMRKVPVGYSLGFVIANASATHGMRVSLGVRILGSLTGR